LIDGILTYGNYRGDRPDDYYWNKRGAILGATIREVLVPGGNIWGTPGYIW